MATDPNVPESILLLRSIDASLKELVSGMRARKAAGPKEVASDRDLDGKYGDPKVTANPRDWNGPSFKGRKYSECPAEFLDLVAEMMDYFAQKADQNNERTDKGKPVSFYKRGDAARARGWAKRIREGKHTPPPVESNGHGFASGGQDDSDDWSRGDGGWN